FAAGYVPSDQDTAKFAQALRAIGEPIMDRPAQEISMARLLTQLFEVTGQFNMVTQPQLLLLQKTMVVVEGVARTLNPELNMWVTAEPVVRDWVERKLGPAGQIEGAISSLAHMAGSLPAMFEDARKAAGLLSGMAQSGGLKLDVETTEQLAKAQARHWRLYRFAMVLAALALVVIAARLVL
ncbi:MAG TPA: ubiquinone biosynthesis protein UbiB, partial [Aestuariivirga sp.]|nr:ubiquinone biosynthesis protein UbiB [Aestuariivirga sp.]